MAGTVGGSSQGVARVSPRFQIPPSTIWSRQVWESSTFSQNDFAQLADTCILGIWPFYALAVAGVYVLRRKRPDLERPYRVWLPSLPALFLIASLGMVVNAIVTDPGHTGVDARYHNVGATHLISVARFVNIRLREPASPTITGLSMVTAYEVQLCYAAHTLVARSQWRLPSSADAAIRFTAEESAAQRSIRKRFRR